MAKPIQIALALMVLLTAGHFGALHAAPELVSREFKVKVGIARVELTRWNNQPAIMVLSRESKDKSHAPAQLRLVQLRDGKLSVAARWPMPRGLRWVEPVPLSGGKVAWLALIGPAWYLAEGRGRRLNWRLLCRCETLFSSGQGPLPFNARCPGPG